MSLEWLWLIEGLLLSSSFNLFCNLYLACFYSACWIITSPSLTSWQHKRKTALVIICKNLYLTCDRVSVDVLYNQDKEKMLKSWIVHVSVLCYMNHNAPVIAAPEKHQERGGINKTQAWKWGQSDSANGFDSERWGGDVHLKCRIQHVLGGVEVVWIRSLCGERWIAWEEEQELS